MSLVTPGIGLIIWTTFTFLILLFLLGKFAWKPILKAVRQREESIEQALNSADKAREEMSRLKADNEKILRQAREERDGILKEAREIKDSMITEAKGKAGQEADKIIEQAREQIENEKMRAITELKNSVGKMSIDIAEKILRQELSDKDKQRELVENQLKDFKLN
ncbi:MAG: F0F1 ATP synthase subunit B [Owenweeksia sp.]|nr:F0F1 ATP synthase subunit B [Owenweeksia sp.]